MWASRAGGTFLQGKISLTRQGEGAASAGKGGSVGSEFQPLES